MYLSHRVFKDTSFDELSVIGIPELLLNIVYCYGFVQDVNTKLILTFRRKLVSDDLSKGFVVLDHYFQALNNVPLRVKKYIHDIDMFDSDYVITSNDENPSVANNLKKIYLSTTILNEFTFKDDYDNNYSFETLFRKYTPGSINKIYRPSLIESWEANVYKASYEDKLEQGVYNPSIKRELDRSMN